MGTTAPGIWLLFHPLVMEGNPSSSYSFQWRVEAEKGKRVLGIPLHQGIAVWTQTAQLSLWSFVGYCFGRKQKQRAWLLWLIDLTLGLLSRVCHAKSDLMSASSTVLFWQHFLKLDFKCLLGVLNESFFMWAQLFRLKWQWMLLQGCCLLQKIPSLVPFPFPPPSLRT